MGTFVRRKTVRLVAIVALAVAFVFSGVAAAQAWTLPPIVIIDPIFHLPPWLLGQSLTGTVVDAGTTAKIGGIIVSAYETSSSAYVNSTVTDANGNFRLPLDPGTYSLAFRDPKLVYGEQWLLNQANIKDSTSAVLSFGLNSAVGTVSLKKAAAILTTVRRANHPLTVLPGMFVVIQQKSTLNTVVTENDVTDGSGVVGWAGLRPQNVTYKESAIDASGRFFANDSTAGWHTAAGDQLTKTYIDMTPAGSSREITPTVPTSSKTSRSANVKFKVTGSFSKAIANGSQIKILAIKTSSGARKSFSGTIKSGSYSATIKLPKGTWKLYALFKGNATFAANDSLNGRTFKVK